MGNVDGGFDVRTGFFRAGYPGTWRISVSMRSALNVGETSIVYIYHNGQKIEDSRFFTRVWYTASGSVVDSMGSRTLLIHLDTGDTVSLRTENIGWFLAD